MILLPRMVLPDGRGGAPLSDVAIRVEGPAIAEIGPAAAMVSAHPGLETIDLGDCVIMPGLVNAHQHGRGLSALQHGNGDDYLELVIAARHGRKSPAPGPMVALACARMLKDGVTCTIQANVSFGGGDYEAQIRAMLAAYDQSGMRAAVCVGAQDQGWIVYPQQDEEAFLAGLPDDVRDEFAGVRRTAYAGDAAATIALMDRLLADYHGHPRIRLFYGPAGPQWLSDEAFTALADGARQQGVGFHLHCLETRTQHAALRRLYPEGTLAHLDRLGVLGPKTSLAHCVFLTAEDIDLAAERDITLVRNPGSNLRLHNGAAPLAQFLAHGVRVAIGTDNRALVEGEDLFKEARLAQALARSDRWDAPPPPDASQLFTMATANGAHAAGFGAETGVLEAGRKADLIALSLDGVRGAYLDPDVSPIDAVMGRAEGRHVRLTMVDGRVLARDGELKTMDEASLRARARAAADAVHHTLSTEQQSRLQVLRTHMAAHYRNLTGG